ncbi:MAG: hypothetical protein ABL952_00415 [Pyrinomonadaceae bacterium]
MGSLFRFDLRRYAETYDLPVLFETGTFRGNGVRIAVDAGFEQIFSVEIVDEYYRANVEGFSDQHNVTIIKGESAAVLGKTVSEIKGNILFWLDAHFPGADGGLCSYNSCEDEAVRCPLEHELETIKACRPDRNDVFIIDDLSIYEAGDFGNGPLPSHINKPANSSLDFIDRLYSDTHHIIRLYDDEGYVLLLPNELPPKLYLIRTLSEIYAKAGVPIDEAFTAAFGTGFPNH